MDKLGIKQRILFILHDKKYPIMKMAGNSEPLRVKLSRQINGEGSVSLDTVNLVCDTFPDVNPAWLLRGEGYIYRTDDAKTTMIVKDSINYGGINNNVSISNSNNQYRQPAKESALSPAEYHYDATTLSKIISDLGIIVPDARALFGLQSILTAKDKALEDSLRQIHDLQLELNTYHRILENPQLLNSIKP